ncbi:MAG: TetR/AcrR family transcriptional regulator, lmrAB and yxaGH operons repressor [Solirubrobacterales bacterium]|nr:TetR/AcrR family transcriptional regulator, lmrAB and yxaGH operons repressor [Solirubrobacterales bacterium]
MARRTDTRRRMVAAAGALFRAQGYHATGLNQLVATGGAPKGSLYFHFPGGKEQLAVEAMREAAAEIRDQLRAAGAAAPDPAGAIVLVIDGLAAELVGTDFRSGCPLATVALDAASASEPIAAACREGYRSWRDTIAELLREHGLGADRAAALATVALSAVEGALLLARTERDLSALNQVKEHLVTVLRAEHTAAAAMHTEEKERD